MMLFFEPTQKIGFLVQNNNIPDTWVSMPDFIFM
jgi:hypothetical protein